MNATWIALLVGVGALVVVELRHLLRRAVVIIIGSVVGAVAAIFWLLRRSVVFARRALRWLRRRSSHLLAYCGALWSKPARLWRHRSPRTRAIGHRVLLSIRVVTTPLRAVIRGVFTRLSGVERLVSGSGPVVAALAGSAAGREAPELRTVYAERLDAMQLSFVIGENRYGEVHRQRRWVKEVLDRKSHQVELAIDGATHLATALVSASEGRIDAVGGLIIPCCERAVARFLGVQDVKGPPLFAAGQLLLHRAFLNPASPAGISDWYAELASREATREFRRVLEECTAVADFAPDCGRNGSTRDDRLSAAIMLATAIGPHVAWVASYVLDELLRHRSQLGRQNPWGLECKLALGDGESRATDRRVRLILEAMRHHPVVSGLIRDCPYATDLTCHDDAARRPLRTGVTFVYTRTAEFDRAQRGSGRRSILAFDPDRFAPSDGEAQGPPLMSFSHGLHECLGRDTALRLMVAILDPLLSQERIRRDSTWRGFLRQRLRRYSPLKSSGAWPFPTNLDVQFDAGIRA